MGSEVLISNMEESLTGQFKGIKDTKNGIRWCKLNIKFATFNLSALPNFVVFLYNSLKSFMSQQPRFTINFTLRSVIGHINEGFYRRDGHTPVLSQTFPFF
jgi:hypothetical protein